MKLLTDIAMKPIIACPKPRNFGTQIQAHPYVAPWDPHGDIDQYHYDIAVRRKPYNFVLTNGESGFMHTPKENKELIDWHSIYSFTSCHPHPKRFPILHKRRHNSPPSPPTPPHEPAATPDLQPLSSSKSIKPTRQKAKIR